MKKLNLYLLGILLLIITPMLQSCGDDDLGKFVVRMATIQSTGNNSFYMIADNGKTIFPAAPALNYYQAIDGQRVVVNYTPLYENYGSYDYGVRVNSLSNVLTKMPEELNAGNEEEFGDDPVYVLKDVWMGNQYLNIIFYMDMPRSKKHRISLVKNTLAEDAEDGYIHLEYRYNDQDDLSGYLRKGIVSFNLKEYFTEEYADYQGIKIRFNLREEGEKTFTYTFNSSDNDKEIEDPDELIDPEYKFM